MSIVGHWIGSYFQERVINPWTKQFDAEENTFPLEAWIDTDGELLTGAMIDLVPVSEVRYSQLIMSQERFMSPTDLRQANEFLLHFPDCRYRMSLFPTSTIIGKVNGLDVHFSKTYSGKCSQSYLFGGQEQTTEYDSPPIEYSGKLNEDGTLITGTYSFLTGTENNRQEGLIQTFELRRAPN